MFRYTLPPPQVFPPTSNRSISIGPSSFADRRPVTANPRFAVECLLVLLGRQPVVPLRAPGPFPGSWKNRASGIPIEEFVGDEDSEA